jgi:hypothetical protein
MRSNGSIRRAGQATLPRISTSPLLGSKSWRTNSRWIAKPSCSRSAPTPGDSLELSDRNVFNLAVHEEAQQPDVRVGAV